jgi:four helix bundle protein
MTHSSKNILIQKTYVFALRIVKLSQFLIQDKKESILSKQILRSGTSIGANTEESVGGQSKKDFISKLSIAYKEARETRYWLHLLQDAGYISFNQACSLLNDCEEILKILGKTLSTIRKKQKDASLKI